MARRSSTTSFRRQARRVSRAATSTCRGPTTPRVTTCFRRCWCPSTATRSCATPSTSATPAAWRRRCSAADESQLEGWGHMIFKPAERGRDAVAPGRGVLGAATSSYHAPSARGCRSTTSTSTTAASGSCPARTAAGCCRTATSATIPPCTSSSSSTTVDTVGRGAGPDAAPARRASTTRARSTRRGRTRPTGRGGRGPTSSRSRRSRSTCRPIGRGSTEGFARR